MEWLLGMIVGLLIGAAWPVGNQRWYAGTIRPSGWLRWLPLYVSPLFSTGPGWPLRLGIAVGTFGRAVYVVRI